MSEPGYQDLYSWAICGPVPGFLISKDYGKTWIPSPLSPEKPLFLLGADGEGGFSEESRPSRPVSEATLTSLTKLRLLIGVLFPADRAALRNASFERRISGWDSEEKYFRILS